MNKIEEALKHQKEASEIDKKICNKQGVASELGNIGLLYRYMGKLDEALKYLKEALETTRKIGYEQGIATALDNKFFLLYKFIENWREKI